VKERQGRQRNSSMQINEMNMEIALNQYYRTNTTGYNETKHTRSTKGEHRLRNVEESVQNRITDKVIKQQAPDVKQYKPPTPLGIACINNGE
jgi:hypothetical protein